MNFASRSLTETPLRKFTKKTQARQSGIKENMYDSESMKHESIQLRICTSYEEGSIGAW
jgi:hypothetical protein